MRNGLAAWLLLAISFLVVDQRLTQALFTFSVRVIFNLKKSPSHLSVAPKLLPHLSRREGVLDRH